jgi:ethanolamine ammonia-lyase small subunit
MTDTPIRDPFARFRAATRARIGLGRAGDAMPIAPLLAFQLAHAQARDAVHGQVDWSAVANALPPGPVIDVRSAAPDRETYLRRPDLGRRLDEAGAAALTPGDWDLALVIADGLSAAAVMAWAAPTVTAILDRLAGWRVAPVVFARQARVAIGDPIGERLGARLVAVLIGERPGLSTADSLGLYLTFAPRSGRRDSERNCISNIHAGGLSPVQAAGKLAWLATEARRLGLTGVDLKEDSSPADLIGAGAAPRLECDALTPCTAEEECHVQPS